MAGAKPDSLSRNVQPRGLPGDGTVFPARSGKRWSTEAGKIIPQLPENQRDAFFELVLYPAKASAIGYRPYITVGQKPSLCKQGPPRARMIWPEKQSDYFSSRCRFSIFTYPCASSAPRSLESYVMWPSAHRATGRTRSRASALEIVALLLRPNLRARRTLLRIGMVSGPR